MANGGGRKALALFLALSLAGSALAIEQQRLYRQRDIGDPGDHTAELVLSVQQHTTFVEMIREAFGDRVDIDVKEFGAVVGLVKKCRKAHSTFDNAVLWFNDNFLFGNKSRLARNTTTGSVQGYDPLTNVSTAAMLDQNRYNGTGRYNASTGSAEVNATGTGPNEGGNPKRDGFVRARDNEQRWGGCWIPEGFIHVVPSGRMGAARAIIAADNACGGCELTYAGTLYVTDPNNHRWMIDRFEFATSYLYTVHVQTDPWNPDRQGFPDEAIWAYREDGRLRLGLPYSENLNTAMGKFCHDEATVNGEARYRLGPGASNKSDAYEWDHLQQEGGEAGAPPPPQPAPNPDPNVTSSNWTEYRRGAVGNTVECSIEYNFLVAIPFEGFSGAGRVWHGRGQPDDSNAAWRGNSHPHNPERESCVIDTTTWPHNTTCRYQEPGEPADPGHKHEHNTIRADIFFLSQAPFFVHQNPYWDHANSTDSITTTGAPPRFNETCTGTIDHAFNDYRHQAVLVREPYLCDPDAVDGFHLHDGTQTPPIPP